MISPKLHVLCADDDEDTRFLLSVMLSQEEIEVRTAASVSEALELARSENFDLLMLDNTFPDGSGEELCRAIRTFDSQTPIIFYSGAAYEEDRRRGLAAGAQGYLVKPELDGIVETIKRFSTASAA